MSFFGVIALKFDLPIQPRLFCLVPCDCF
jgi:hypothetical protein